MSDHKAPIQRGIPLDYDFESDAIPRGGLALKNGKVYADTTPKALGRNPFYEAFKAAWRADADKGTEPNV